MLYPFLCPNGHSVDRVLRMEERDTTQACSVCGAAMARQMAAGMTVIWQGVWRDQWRDSPLDKGGLDDGLGPQAEGTIKP